jgi:hypothetical protein
MAVYLPIISEFKDKGIKDAEKGFKDLEGAGAKMQYAFKKALVPALAVVGALGGAAVKFALAGEKAATSNARINQIAESMGLFGDETQKVTDRLVELAEKTARQTGIDQNAIKETQAKLLTFKELAESADDVGGSFDRATKAAIDLASAGFGDATSNAVQLGKALNDPIKGITALTRSGVTFTEEEKKKIRTLTESGKILEAQNMILGAIETQVGGTSEATADGSEKMKVAFSQLQESVGMALLPVFEALLPLVEKFAQWAADNPGVVIAIASAVGLLAAAIIAVNIAMAVNPFVLAVAGIAAVAAGVVAAYKKFETFRNIVNGVIDVFKAVAGWIQDNWQLVISIVLGPIGILIANFRALKDIAIKAFEIIADAAEKLLGPISKVVDGVGKVISGAGKVGGAIGGAIGKIPFLADGGIVKARPGGTLAVIGEGGQDEAVVPLRNGRPALSTGGSGGITINVSGALDPVAVARQIEQLLASKQSAFGF